MDNFYLFLDETKPNITLKNFCLAGCIIKADIYETFYVPEVKRIKREVFGSEEVILHEIEIRNANEEPYKIMRHTVKRKYFWSQMASLFSSNSLWVLGAAINCDEYKRLYANCCTNDEYYIALQVILENFTHFLETNNGFGTVFIESRVPKEDEKLQNHYHVLKANGTLFMNKSSLQKRLGTISYSQTTDLL